MKNLNITIEEFRLLFYLWKEDGINQQELASRSNKEKSTITRQINALEKKGLIDRRNQNKDKRNKQIFLTENGKHIEKVALDVARSITQKSEQGISKENLEVFKEVLKQMINNLVE